MGHTEPLSVTRIMCFPYCASCISGLGFEACSAQMSKDRTTSFPDSPPHAPCPSFPDSQAPRHLHAFHIHCPKVPVRSCPGLASPAMANTHAFIHSFILTTSKHLLSACDWQVLLWDLGEPKMDQSQAYSDQEGDSRTHINQ